MVSNLLISQDSSNKLIQSITDTLIFENSKFNTKYLPKMNNELKINIINSYKIEGILIDSKSGYYKGISDAVNNFNSNKFEYYGHHLTDPEVLVRNNKMELNVDKFFRDYLFKKFKITEVLYYKRFINDPYDAYHYTKKLITNYLIENKFGKDFFSKTQNEVNHKIKLLMSE